jgi:hypothetical protein
MEPAEDSIWHELESAAARLNALSDDTVEVWAFRRRSRKKVTEGLDAGDKWVYGLAQTVRWRPPSSALWHEVQSVAQAAAPIEKFLRERPDRRPPRRWRSR